jgi:hypothetical protein
MTETIAIAGKTDCIDAMMSNAVAGRDSRVRTSSCSRVASRAKLGDVGDWYGFVNQASNVRQILIQSANGNDHVVAANDSPLQKLNSATHVHRLVRRLSSHWYRVLIQQIASRRLYHLGRTR